MSDGDHVAVGHCPDHGIVSGGSVSLNFPNESTCECGLGLTRAGVADAQEVEDLAG